MRWSYPQFSPQLVAMMLIFNELRQIFFTLRMCSHARMGGWRPRRYAPGVRAAPPPVIVKNDFENNLILE